MVDESESRDDVRINYSTEDYSKKRRVMTARECREVEEKEQKAKKIAKILAVVEDIKQMLQEMRDVVAGVDEEGLIMNIKTTELQKRIKLEAMYCKTERPANLHVPDYGGSCGLCAEVLHLKEVSLIFDDGDHNDLVSLEKVSGVIDGIRGKRTRDARTEMETESRFTLGKRSRGDDDSDVEDAHPEGLLQWVDPDPWMMWHVSVHATLPWEFAFSSSPIFSRAAGALVSFRLGFVCRASTAVSQVQRRVTRAIQRMIQLVASSSPIALMGLGYLHDVVVMAPQAPAGSPVVAYRPVEDTGTLGGLTAGLGHQAPQPVTDLQLLAVVIFRAEGLYWLGHQVAAFQNYLQAHPAPGP
ncbi:hypothetical protein KFL_009290010 [Klebsormidium nitens]|uniref:Uncharacterized protein n=1 Tax=Klebsormidium nitens TaxID=105231 RepID=A0A1Y1IRK3_KLENI|nr:hypothetical protein KFL_009290010 [Klebsormidium nitens]|eukprot:GAQ92129.1 hypothetical protein KFL_009290010 [Klebsormidium nitens]